MRQMTLLSELRPKVTATKVVLRSAWAKHYAHAWTAGLIVLVLVTSWAVASVSLWLVPPYLLVMGFVLFAPGGRTNDEPQASILVGPHAAIEPLIDNSLVTDEEESVSNASGAAFPAANPGSSRKSKGRRKQAAKTQPEPPPEATWIQVGPGKFVRVEGSAVASDQIAQPETLITPTADSEIPPAENSVETLHEFVPSEPLNEWEDEDDFTSPESATLIETETATDAIAEDNESVNSETLEDETESFETDEYTEDHGIAPEASDEFEEVGIEPGRFDEPENHGIAPEVSVEFEVEGTEPEAFESELEDHGIAPEASEEYSELEDEQAEYDEFEQSGIVAEEIEDEAVYGHVETLAETTEDEFVESEHRALGTINAWLPSRKYVLRRNLRTARKTQLPAGYRHRSERGSGRKRRAGSRSHIRSPPSYKRSA